MSEKRQDSERYQRQLILQGFGAEGQRKLLGAKVLIVGAGGLGCPALLYLAAAGVGTIGIVDNDTVSLTNLHRQVIYATKDIGLLKTEVAARRLREMNPDIEVHTHHCFVSNTNALDILKEYDLVVDATDNMMSRYIISDACLLLNKPLVYGGISRFEGQVAVLNYRTAGERPVTFRDLFPIAPAPDSLANCTQTGVLGVLPGIIGTMQATEVLKLLTGIGDPLIHRLFTYNALTNSTYTFQLSARPETEREQPKDEADFKQTDYQAFCHISTMDAAEIDTVSFQSLLGEPNLLVIDVRENGELPEVYEFPHQKIPLTQLRTSIPAISNDTIVLFCQSGKRSREAAQLLKPSLREETKIFSLKGGILHWKQQLHTKGKS